MPTLVRLRSTILVRKSLRPLRLERLRKGTVEDTRTLEVPGIPCRGALSRKPIYPVGDRLCGLLRQELTASGFWAASFSVMTSTRVFFLPT